jgi:uncharacterized membrane protein YbhN (UPF0104 family)
MTIFLLFTAGLYVLFFVLIALRLWIVRKRKGLSRWRVGKRGLTKREPEVEEFEKHYFE